MPEFDERVHLALCEELKELYVCTTRARERLVFFDQSVQERAPFYAHALAQNAAKAHTGVIEPGGSAGAALARRSQQHEWRKRGYEFVEQQNFAQAAVCFEKCSDDDLVFYCRGRDFQAQASDTATDAEQSSLLLLNAAALLAKSEVLRRALKPREPSRWTPDAKLAAFLEEIGEPALGAMLRQKLSVPDRADIARRAAGGVGTSASQDKHEEDETARRIETVRCELAEAATQTALGADCAATNERAWRCDRRRLQEPSACLRLRMRRRAIAGAARSRALAAAGAFFKKTALILAFIWLQ